MNPKISVIVPIYKVEEYLSRCIDSLVNQTYRDFEVILVDDGSPDRCPELCDTYEKRYEYIRALHKANGGLSDARNAGLQLARGDYITFVDSDDYVSPLYLERLMDGIRKGADLAVCGFMEVYDDATFKEEAPKETPIAVMTGIDGLTEILYQKFHDVSACGILLPKYLAEKYLFPKGKLFEDLYTTYKFYLEVEKVAFVYEALYYYFQRKGSIMGQRDDAFIHDLIEASDLLVKACKGKGVKLEQAALNKQFSNDCRLILLAPDLRKKYSKVYLELMKNLRGSCLSVLADSRARKKNRIAALALLLGGETGLKIAFRLKSEFMRV